MVKTLSVVIPVYNEETRIEDTLKKIREIRLGKGSSITGNTTKVFFLTQEQQI
ncbi:hypothetical protein ACFL5I_01985 [Planctomycetota bacterium]